MWISNDLMSNLRKHFLQSMFSQRFFSQNIVTFYNRMIACKPNHQPKYELIPKSNITKSQKLSGLNNSWTPSLWKPPSKLSHWQDLCQDEKLGRVSSQPCHASLQARAGGREVVCSAPSWIAPRFPSARRVRGIMEYFSTFWKYI